jgi:hypothetical protein
MSAVLTKTGQLLASMLPTSETPRWVREHVDGDEDRDIEDCTDKLACFGLVETGEMADARDDLTHISLTRDPGSALNYRAGLWLDGLLF